MKDMIKMGMFLFVISAIAGLLLAGTEALTAPKIAENKRLALEMARKEVLPGAVLFKTVNFEGKEKNNKTYSAGFNENSVLVGIVEQVSPKGYGGPIEMVMGINKQGKISGIKILSLKETPGLGTKLKGPKFLNAFKKLIASKVHPNFTVTKDGGDVDGITAATISSRAFCKGITSGYKLFETVKSNLNKIKAPVKTNNTKTGGTK